MEWTKDQIDRVNEELNRWKGLPHLDRRAIPGKGIDCIHLVFSAIFASGLVEPRKIPAYRPRWGLVSPVNLMAEGLSLILHATRHRATEPRFGDIVIWPSGKQSNHCGIIAHAEAGNLACWHVMKGGKVHAAPIETTVPQAQEIVRINQAGWKLDPPDQLKLKDLRNERK